MGTWELNEVKSKITAGMAKNSTVLRTMDGDSVKVAIDGTDAIFRLSGIHLNQ
jgi:hypothetical protein